MGSFIRLVIIIYGQTEGCCHSPQCIQLTPPFGNGGLLLFKGFDFGNRLPATSIGLQGLLINHRILLTALWNHSLHGACGSCITVSN